MNLNQDGESQVIKNDYEATQAFRELFETMQTFDKTFLNFDEQTVIEGYSNLISTLSAAIDCYIAADPLRRKPMRRYAGDTADAYDGSSTGRFRWDRAFIRFYRDRLLWVD